MFVGFFELGSTFSAPLLVRDTGLSPVDADSLPVYRVYGPSGVLSAVAGSCVLEDTGTVTNATNASPVVYTSANHGLASGFVVTVSGVLGNVGANTFGVITAIDANTFSISGSSGTGSYTSGGIWHMTGLYSYTFNVSMANGFTAGNLYVTLLEGTSGGITFSYTQSFQVD